jgi:L-lactate dehydrogenase
MNNNNIKVKRKVTIVGAGAVGSTFAYALAQRGVAEEIVITDLNTDLAKGQVLDLVHGFPYYPTVKIRFGAKEDFADSNIIVITAGAKQQSGESRLDLLQKNVRIIENIVDDVVAQNSPAILIVVSNPVDILTYFAWRRSSWPRHRVIGSGTVLDSARLRYLLSEHCQVNVQNVHAYILGEHGDSEFAAWSLGHIGGIPLDNYCRSMENDLDRNKIEQQVKDSAYHIIDYKGATYYAVGLALVRITEAIFRNQNSVLTICSVLQGEYGLKDVCLGIPTLVNESGAGRIIESKLTKEEIALLHHSASVIKNAIREVTGK